MRVLDIARDRLRGLRGLPLPLAAAFLLAAATFWDAAHTLWRLRGEPLATPPARVQRLWNLPRPGSERVKILAAHLFGREPMAGGDARVAERLHLQLTGTLSWADPALGAAIIRKPDGSSHVYRAGDQTPGGATLLAIYRDHVVLRATDGDEILGLEKPDQGAAASHLIEPEEDVADASSSSADSTAAQDPFAPPPLPTVGAVMRSLNLRPITQHGDSAGWRIGGGVASAAALAKVGLAPGDMLVSVNGQPVENSSAGVIMQAVNSGQSAMLTVEHAGSVIDVELNADQADAMASAYRQSGQPQ